MALSHRLAHALSALLLATVPGAVATARAASLEVTIAHVEREAEDRGFEAETPPLPPPGGLDGSRLGIADANASGAFRDQAYRLEEKVVPVDGDFAAAVTAVLDAGIRYLVVRAGPWRNKNRRGSAGTRPTGRRTVARRAQALRAAPPPRD